MRISDWSSDVCSSDLCGSEEELVCCAVGSAKAQSVKLQDALEVREQHLDLLSLAARGDVSIGEGEIARHVTCTFVNRARDLAGGLAWTAVLLECASITVALGCPVSKEAVLIRSEEHTSELQSLMRISYAVFCLKKKTQKQP